MHITLLVLCLQSPLLGRENSGPFPDCYFMDEVWDELGEVTCLKDHHALGESKDSRVILREIILLTKQNCKKRIRLIQGLYHNGLFA